MFYLYTRKPIKIHNMGTRNLTMVVHKFETKVAQYGQWDGYPSGNGLKVLDFLRKHKMITFKEKLSNVRFVTDEDRKEIDNYLKSIGSKDGWINMDQARKYHERYPYLSRDIGADILDMIYNYAGDEKMMINDETKFASDSLFCEWAYLINLDTNELEVYEGFNKRKLGKTQRFKYLEEKMDEDSNGYFPIRCVKKYDINELPTNEQFLKDLKQKEE